MGLGVWTRYVTRDAALHAFPSPNIHPSTHGNPTLPHPPNAFRCWRRFGCGCARSGSRGCPESASNGCCPCAATSSTYAIQANPPLPRLSLWNCISLCVNLYPLHLSLYSNFLFDSLQIGHQFISCYYSLLCALMPNEVDQVAAFNLLEKNSLAFSTRYCGYFPSSSSWIIN